MTFGEFVKFQEARGIEPVSREQFDELAESVAKVAVLCNVLSIDVWSALRGVCQSSTFRLAGLALTPTKGQVLPEWDRIKTGDTNDG